MNKKVVQMSQEELTNKTIRRIYNRGKRKGYVSPEYIEKTIKNKNIPREKIEEISPAIQEAMRVSGPSLIEFKMSLELNTSTTTISQLQMNINN